MTKQLKEAIIEKLHKLDCPPSNLYPALHRIAADLNLDDYAEAVGAVFQVMCEVCDVKYGSQYMDKGLVATYSNALFLKELCMRQSKG